VIAANRRWAAWQEAGEPEPAGRRIISADVARTGSDETVLGTRTGNVLQTIERRRDQDTVATAREVRSRLTYPRALSIVDSVGVGAGVVDNLRDWRQPVVPFTGSAGTARTDSTGEYGFTNTRSAAYWNLRELLDPARGANLALPDDELLTADLTCPKWSVTTGAKIKVEPKEDVVKRLGRSPDAGDMAVMAWWISGGIESEAAVATYADNIPELRTKPAGRREAYSSGGWTDAEGAGTW
jgi:hypothetical protein